MTQADLIHATHQARQWFERNRRRFRYYLPERDDRTWEEVFDELLNEVETPLHLYALSDSGPEHYPRRKAEPPQAHPHAARRGTHPPSQLSPSKLMKENKAASRTSYTQAKGDRICELIAEGKSLVTILKEEEDLPSYVTVIHWLRMGEKEALAGGKLEPGTLAHFRDSYSLARQDQAEYMAETLLEVAQNAEATSAGVQQARLISDNIKWSASHLLPKVYGDRIDMKIDASSLPPPPVIVQIVNAPKPKQLDVVGAEIIEAKQIEQ